VLELGQIKHYRTWRTEKIEIAKAEFDALLKSAVHVQLRLAFLLGNIA
jgi:hypothetical protein